MRSARMMSPSGSMKAGPECDYGDGNQQENEKLLVLKAAIQEGYESGISQRGVKDIMAEVEERLRVDGKLPLNQES